MTEVERFSDDDEGFREWISNNPLGYLLNCVKGNGKDSGPYMLHRADCASFSGRNADKKFTTDGYDKICSIDRKELTKWRQREYPRNEVTECNICNP